MARRHESVIHVGMVTPPEPWPRAPDLPEYTAPPDEWAESMSRIQEEMLRRDVERAMIEEHPALQLFGVAEEDVRPGQAVSIQMRAIDRWTEVVSSAILPAMSSVVSSVCAMPSSGWVDTGRWQQNEVIRPRHLRLDAGELILPEGTDDDGMGATEQSEDADD